jgi:hypothetical protein
MLASLSVSACGGESGAPEQVRAEHNLLSPPAATHPTTFARQWMVNLANCVKGDTISPPVAARTYAYGAIAMYEAVVHGMPGHQSLAGQLNGLDSLPVPDPTLEYDWPTVLAATMNKFAPAVYVFPERVFFEYTTDTEAPLKALGRTQIAYRRASGVSGTVIDDSVAYGEDLADALIAWANSDGYAEARYKGWIPPKGPDKWVPTGFSDTDKVALPNEPHFGTLRPLALASPNECAAPPPAEFSTDPASDMYAEANAVRLAEHNLTDEQREIARFWADGPGATPTPPGHWLAITTKLVRNTNLAEAAAGYAFVSIGFFDSFIAVWWDKYRWNLLRPETYIRRHIEPHWQAFLPTPPFPEYVSGHSGVSGASAALLTARFGNGPFTDDTKLRRGFGPRNFANFSDAAAEAAASRLYGGIHYPMANNEGIAVGECVAQKIQMRVSLTGP